jgi:hypothetical protein
MVEIEKERKVFEGEMPKDQADEKVKELKIIREALGEDEEADFKRREKELAQEAEDEEMKEDDDERKE